MEAAPVAIGAMVSMADRDPLDQLVDAVCRAHDPIERLASAVCAVFADAAKRDGASQDLHLRLATGSRRAGSCGPGWRPGTTSRRCMTGWRPATACRRSGAELNGM